MSERHALRIVAMSRSAFSYKPKARDCSAIRLRMREITQTRVRYGGRVFVVHAPCYSSLRSGVSDDRTPYP